MSDVSIEATLRQQVEAASGQPMKGAPVVKLKGEASSRSYYRVGSAPASWVTMVMPVESAKKSEEGGAAEVPAELPFINVHRYLDGLGPRGRRAAG